MDVLGVTALILVGAGVLMGAGGRLAGGSGIRIHDVLRSRRGWITSRRATGEPVAGL